MNLILNGVSEVDVTIKTIIFNIKKKSLPNLLRSFYSNNNSNNINMRKYRLIEIQNKYTGCVEGLINIRLVEVNFNNDRIYLVIDFMGNHFKSENFNYIFDKHTDLMPMKNTEVIKVFKYYKTLRKLI